MQKTVILAIGLAMCIISQDTFTQDTKEGQMTHKTLTIPDILKIKSFSSCSRLQLSPMDSFLPMLCKILIISHRSKKKPQNTLYIYRPEHSLNIIVVQSGLPISEQRKLINLVQMTELAGHDGGLRMDAT